MPPKAKAAVTSNGAPKSKAGKSSTTSTGTSTPVPPPMTEEHQDATAVAPTGQGRPDKAIYDTEQENIKKEIDAVQAKLVCHLDSYDLIYADDIL